MSGASSLKEGALRRPHSLLFHDILCQHADVPLHRATGDAIRRSILPGCEHNHLTILNGVFAPQYSVISIPGCSVKTSQVPATALFDQEERALHGRLLDAAHPQEEVLVRFSQTTHLPLHVIFLYSAEKPSWATSSLVFEVEEGVHAHVVETMQYVGSASLMCLSDVAVNVSSRGKFTHSRIEEASIDSIANISSLRATLALQSEYRLVQVSHTKDHHQTVDIALSGEGATCSYAALDKVTSHASSHFNVDVHHQSPKTTSSIEIRGLVGEHASTTTQSCVHVDEQAMGSSSSQLMQYLQLGKTGRAKILPQFAIFTDEVTASHGATTSQIDEELLKYMTSRGLDRDEASCLVAQGFASKIIHMLPTPQEQKWIHTQLY